MPGIHHQQAFSLVELSIVLVILGLLTGGILAGQSLIRAAEIRSVGVDGTRYRAALYSFRDKYFAIPGDMANATSFWGSLGGTGADATCQNTVATGTATCNGNGDGSIGTSVVTSDEQMRYWQHLANAGLVEGSYTGVYGSGPSSSNTPRSKLPNSFFNTVSLVTFVGNPIMPPRPAGIYFNFWNYTASYTTTGSLPLLPEEAWNLDTKYDDGLPMSGGMISPKGNGTNTNCATYAGVAPPGDAGSTFRVDLASKDCTVFFIVK